MSAPTDEILRRLADEIRELRAKLSQLDLTEQGAGGGGGAGFNDSEGDPAGVALAAADGASSYAARRDHVHVGASPAFALTVSSLRL